MADDDDPLNDTRSAMATLTELLAASIAASLARAGSIVGASAQARLWPGALPAALDVRALRLAIQELPLARRPALRAEVIDDVLALIPNRVAPRSLDDLTLEVANLLIHIGHRLESTQDTDARFGVALVTWPCVVEGYFVLETLLLAVDDERLARTLEPLARAVEELVSMAARCTGSVEA